MSTSAYPGAYAASSGSGSSEQLMDLRKHEIGLLGTAIRLLIVAVATGYLIARLGTWGEPERTIALWSAAVLATLFLWTLVIRRFRVWAAMRATVANDRIEIRYRRRRQGWQIPMVSVVDVSYTAGPLQRVFGVGDVVIRTNFSHESAVILGIADVQGVAADLLELRDRAWRQYQQTVAASTQSWNDPPHSGSSDGGSNLQVAS
ncbi:MAG: PH domain-containing protein [Candidatus Nanopelagicales bacterium]